MTNTPFIRPAIASDMDSICMLLHSKMNQKIQPERWRKLFTYEWLKEKPDLGRVVEHRGEILGFLGMVYSDREINHHNHRIVNICAWYLDKSLRGLGLGKGIMADATSDPAMSYTIMTSSKNTVGILDEVDYRILDDSRYIWRRQANSESMLTLITDYEQIHLECSQKLKKLLNDHAQLPVTPILAKFQDQHCLLLFSVKRKAQDVLYFDVLLTSDRVFLGQHGQYLANLLLPEQTALLTADCRLVENAVAADIETLPVPRFYKTTQLSAYHFDHLYTELQLLDLKLD